ncbi:MAG: TetR/AcrR family transcriptional regulator [Propionibacteriaceae bacterium]|jgi:AcrR family transcriptional regulator|nr:TetR/AcrR family transcriptional regulator [Propionibacteriaceae bacterium]
MAERAKPTADGKQRRMRRNDRRQQIIDIARKAFAEYGYFGSSIEYIAEEAGVSKPIIYDHFGDKEGLYSAVVDAEMKILTKMVFDAVRDVQDDVFSHLARSALAILTYAEERPLGFQIIARFPRSYEPRDPGPWQPTLLDDFADRLAKEFRVVLTQFGHDPVTMGIYTHMIIGAVELATRWWGLHGGEHGITKEQMAAFCTGFNWYGVDKLPLKPPPLPPMETPDPE